MYAVKRSLRVAESAVPVAAIGESERLDPSDSLRFDASDWKLLTAWVVPLP